MTILSWQGRGLKLETAGDVEGLLEGVDPLKIEEVRLGGNTFGVDASKAMGDFLAKAENIKIADFADIFTGRLISEIPQALTSLCNALIDKQHLVEINLSDNAFGGRSVDPIVPFLVGNRNFQILKLNNNGLGPAGGQVIAHALLESALKSKSEGKSSNLRTVICGRNRLENGSAPSWAKAFEAHGTLVEVRMPQNGIWMDGIIALAKGLAKNPDLEYIDLQDNTFTHGDTLSGVETWASSLPAWKKLHTLNLSDCVLSPEGSSEAPALIAALASGSNPKLRSLSLQNNNLEKETFALVAENIGAGFGNLSSLELQWNEYDEDDEDVLEHIKNIRSAMRKRRGRLIITDEDEEEDEEEDEAEVEAEAVEGEAETLVETDIKAEETEEPQAPTSKEDDDLARLMSKVTINNS